MMTNSICFGLCCIAITYQLTDAFMVAPSSSLQQVVWRCLSSPRITDCPLGAIGARQQGKSNDPEVTVFDAGDSAVSWEDYENQKKLNEFKMDEVDEMTCWKTDECPVEDDAKFTKAWRVHSAERNPTTETHFDSEGEWEEESKWSQKWHEDVGEDDLHEEIAPATSNDGFGI